MHIKFTLSTIVLVTLTLSSISSRSSNKKDKNKFFVKNHTAKEDDKDKALKSGSMDFLGSQKGAPTRKPIVGGSKYYDDLVGDLFHIGDSYGGLPDNIQAVTKYCHTYTAVGLKAWGYISVRWSKKFLLKSMVSLMAIGLLKSNGIYCKNTVSMNDYIKKAKLVNQNNEDLVKIRKEFQTRIENIMDKIENLNDKSQHVCCAFYDYKNKSIDATRADVHAFLESMINGLFSENEILFCQSILGQSSPLDTPSVDCDGIKFTDVDSSNQALGRNWLFQFTNLLTQYV